MFVSGILEKLALSLSFSLRFKSPDLYLSCTTKDFPKFLLPFQCQASFQSEQFGPTTMQHGRCHWSRALCQVSGRACSCKKDPCCLCHSRVVGSYLVLLFISILMFLSPTSLQPSRFLRPLYPLARAHKYAASIFCIVFYVLQIPGWQIVQFTCIINITMARLSYSSPTV